MLFNSLEFILFLPVVFFAYWFIFRNNIKWQNALVIAASYFFYGWWDWRFLLLIVFSSSLDFILGQKIYLANQVYKKYFLWISLICNLGLLAIFKYFNFFIDSFITTFNFLGITLNSWTLSIILPVGISFYTFQTLSYTIDIYRGTLKPSRDLLSFFAFVSFFPQLVAGPIERAKDLLPQFESKRRFQHGFAIDGLRQMLWGFFKKVVIADNCGIFVDKVFSNYLEYSSGTLIFSVFLFCIQVYADFSGYSDIAIGSAKLFGITLKDNFKYPYFSTSWGEFWKRWHISLSSWILDYVYNPIAIKLRNFGTNGIILALIITFTLNGLWHGAGWTFIIFGFLLGVYIGTEFYFKRARKRTKKIIGKKINNFVGWGVLTVGWMFACIIFRSESISDSFKFTAHIFNQGQNSFLDIKTPVFLLVFIFFLFIMEYFNKNESHPMAKLTILPVSLRWIFYFLFLFFILSFCGKSNNFIYFQF